MKWIVIFIKMMGSRYYQVEFVLFFVSLSCYIVFKIYLRKDFFIYEIKYILFRILRKYYLDRDTLCDI